MFFCLVRYKDFLLLRARQLSFLRGANEGTQLYMTGIITVEYLLQPLTIILVYCAAEGAIRSLAAWLGDEILPVTPLKLVHVFQQWVRRRRIAAGYGPLVPDVVERAIESPPQLKITSCRPKEGWRESVTIMFEEKFYDLVRAEQTPAPYRYIYYLQQKPEGTIVRGMYHYMP